MLIKTLRTLKNSAFIHTCMVFQSYCKAFKSKLAEPQTEAEAHFLSSHAQKFGLFSYN